MKNIKAEPVSNIAADALLEEILKREDGEYLGLEAELSEKLGISAPSLRQAAKLLEYQQLLTIKRGRGGGYYARYPSTEGVIHMAAIVLRAHEASVAQTLNALKLISVEASRLACACRDETARKQLSMLGEQATHGNMEKFLTDEIAFDHHIADMSKDPVLGLFSDIILAFAKVHRGPKIFRLVDRQKKFVALRAELTNAILNRDTALAAEIFAKRFTLMERWQKADSKTS